MTLKNVTDFEDSFSEEVWNSTYRYHSDKDVNDTFRRVAKAVASVEKTEELQKDWEEKFYDLLSNFKATAGGRIYSNAGTEWEGISLLNCFVGVKPKYDQDSVEGIIGTLLAQTKTLKSEGGWGMNFSFIRPRGSFIYGIGVESPGAVKYMELFDKSSDIITAGSGLKKKNLKGKEKIRKGAQMAVLDCWHPDVEEFITAKLTPGRLSKFNISVNCLNKFMDKIIEVKKLIKDGAPKEEIEKCDKWDLIFPETKHEKYKEEWDGDIERWIARGFPVNVYKTVSATELWNKIIKSTYTRNDPGVLFTDIANKTHCLNYGGKLTKISATNPCVSEGTLVNTPDGYRKVEDIKVGDKISTLHPDGYEPVKTIEVHENVPVYKVKFSDGGEQIVTAAHRYFAKKLRLDELKVGDSIQVEPTRLQNTQYCDDDYKKGLILGILLGDGCYTERAILSSGSVKIAYNKAVKKILEGNGYNFIKDWEDLNSLSMYMILDKASSSKLIKDFKLELKYANEKYIPLEYINNYSKAMGIINGLLATNGNVNLKSNHPQIRFNTSSTKLAQSIRNLLLNLGIHSRISEDNNKNKGGHINGRKIRSNYPKYTVNVSGFDFKELAKLCYNNIYISKSDKIKYAKLSGGSRSASIVSIEPFGNAKVYDLFCEESDSWITEGYVQQGCGEQQLPFGFVCLLGSLNLTQFIDLDTKTFDFEKIKKYIKIFVRFLDNVNDYTKAPLPEYEWSVKNARRIGLGIMGWGSALYLLNVKFGSDKAEEIKSELMKVITHTAVETSIDLAEEKGMFPLCQPDKHADAEFFKIIGLPDSLKDRIRKSGIRNSALFSIQPTGNTSIFANIVSGGCEPLFLWEYIRTVIVNVVPDHIKDVCPKYWEGEFVETDMFKFTKEGDETILRGVDENGTVYKIDKNRGLTKEVLCEDYGVRHLKKLGQWDPKADWAVTTESLSVDDHIRDMSGWARWVDSSISKTIGVPNNYPFEKFENVYLDAYKTGYIKGITTYRSGTMTTVLSSKKEEEKPVSKIPKTNAPKRPHSLDCDIYHIKVSKKDNKGDKKITEYCVVVGLMDGDPYEAFAFANGVIDKKYKTGKLKKLARGKYQLEFEDGVKIDDITEFTTEEEDVVSRLISSGLRHGASIDFIVHQLEKTKSDDLLSFSKSMARALKKYIKNDTVVSGEECEECGGKLIRQEGCVRCSQCSWTKCT